jgi:hypothetical protein
MAKKTVGKTIRRKTVRVTLPSGKVMTEFDTRKPEDLLRRAIDPNPLKRFQIFEYDLQPYIPTPWYFRAADAIINAVEATEEAIEKAWAALGKVIANGDFHHRS